MSMKLKRLSFILLLIVFALNINAIPIGNSGNNELLESTGVFLEESSEDFSKDAKGFSTNEIIHQNGTNTEDSRAIDSIIFELLDAPDGNVVSTTSCPQTGFFRITAVDDLNNGFYIDQNLSVTRLNVSWNNGGDPVITDNGTRQLVWSGSYDGFTVPTDNGDNVVVSWSVVYDSGETFLASSIIEVNITEALINFIGDFNVLEGRGIVQGTSPLTISASVVANEGYVFLTCTTDNTVANRDSVLVNNGVASWEVDIPMLADLTGNILNFSVSASNLFNIVTTEDQDWTVHPIMSVTFSNSNNYSVYEGTQFNVKADVTGQDGNVLLTCTTDTSVASSLVGTIVGDEVTWTVTAPLLANMTGDNLNFNISSTDFMGDAVNIDNDWTVIPVMDFSFNNNDNFETLEGQGTIPNSSPLTITANVYGQNGDLNLTCLTDNSVANNIIGSIANGVASWEVNVPMLADMTGTTLNFRIDGIDFMNSADSVEQSWLVHPLLGLEIDATAGFDVYENSQLEIKANIENHTGDVTLLCVTDPTIANNVTTTVNGNIATWSVNIPLLSNLTATVLNFRVTINDLMGNSHSVDEDWTVRPVMTLGFDATDGFEVLEGTDPLVVKANVYGQSGNILLTCLTDLSLANQLSGSVVNGVATWNITVPMLASLPGNSLNFRIAGVDELNVQMSVEQSWLVHPQLDLAIDRTESFDIYENSQIEIKADLLNNVGDVTLSCTNESIVADAIVGTIVGNVVTWLIDIPALDSFTGNILNFEITAIDLMGNSHLVADDWTVYPAISIAFQDNDEFEVVE
ncbi:MAG: hypothetical protein B6226_04850, partial [Candidatus Cloacimonetes bacterium 4572_65]